MSSLTPYGQSLHIGVNEVDPGHYGGYGDPLEGPENDASFMAELARGCGFQSKVLLGRDATADAVLCAILDAADTLPSESYFLLTFAGHGIQTRNDDRVPDDQENYDQNWCLYDRAVLDDELRRRCWPRFASRVRIVVVIDACHSGSSVYALNSGVEAACRFDFGYFCRRTRELPRQFAARTYRQNEKQYRNILDALPPPAPINAYVLAMAACQDQERAADGPHGAFTQAIKEVWDNGNFSGTHMELMTPVRKLVTQRNRAQHPTTCCRYVAEILDAKAFMI